jgi:hypothetical protein
MRERTAKLLVDASVVDMTTEAGRQVEVWTIASHATYVTASAPRLLVAEGMQLHCRLLVDGLPHRVLLRVEHAFAKSESRAGIRLCVTEVIPDGMQRQSERLELRVAAELTALICDRIVPDDRVIGQVADLSATGIGIHTPDTRVRTGDVMRLHVRFLEGTVTTEVRVKRCTTGDQPGTIHVGCLFATPNPGTQQTVSRVLARLAARRLAGGTTSRAG